MRAVAERAEVSVGTVSNVLNRPEVVAEPTRQRVLAAISELGFVRNESARQLRSGPSRSIGLLVPDVANPFFTDVARGAEEVAEANGYVLALYNSGEDADREHRHLAHLTQQRVQGVLITPLDSDSDRIADLGTYGIPAVLLYRGSGRRRQCSVTVDDVFGGHLAAGHLVAQGHRRIAFVGPPSVRQVGDRLAGLQSGVSDGSVEVFETAGLTVAAGRPAGERIGRLPVADRPTGIFCANDLLALGVLQEVIAHGLRVPEDVALVGYDDIGFAAAAVVPLSSVRQPGADLGATAMQLLLEEIGDRPTHRHRQVVFEPELVVRASSAGTAPTSRRGRKRGRVRGDLVG
jgi:LacI family transcriptional regulator, galactose operon repressor